MKKTAKMITLLTLASAMLFVQTAYAEPSEELKGIYDTLMAEDSYFSETMNQYTEYFPDIKYEGSLDDTGFTITISGSEYMDGSWSFTQDGDYLTASFSEEDFTGQAILMYVVKAIGEYYDENENLISGYVNGLSTHDIKNDNFILTNDEEAGTTDVRINIAGPFDMKELDQMVIDEKELGLYEPLGEDYGSYAGSVGKLTMVSNGNKDDFTILLGEYDGLDDLAYQSMINIAGTMQPEGWEDFTAGYTELADADAPGYTVSLNVDEEKVREIVDEVFDDYSYAIIHFGA